MMLYEAELRQRDRKRTAYFEAGHIVVCEQFNLAPTCWILEAANATAEESLFVGQTRYSFTNSTPFRESVIAWAGFLAEQMADENGLHSGHHLAEPEVCETIMATPETLPGSEPRANSSRPLEREAFLTARAILTNNASLVHTIASNLLKYGCHPCSDANEYCFFNREASALELPASAA